MNHGTQQRIPSGHQGIRLRGGATLALRRDPRPGRAVRCRYLGVPLAGEQPSLEVLKDSLHAGLDAAAPCSAVSVLLRLRAEAARMMVGLTVAGFICDWRQPEVSG